MNIRYPIYEGVYRILTHELGLPGDLCPYPGHIQVPDTGNGLSLPNGRLPGKAFKMAGTFYKAYS